MYANYLMAKGEGFLIYAPTMYAFDFFITLFMIAFWAVSIGIYLAVWAYMKIEQDTVFPEQKSPWIEFELPSFILTIKTLLGDTSSGMIRIDWEQRR